MNIFETLRVALLDLSLHKFRSALATIGIILGVASVEAMISISEGAKQQTIARIEVLGVDNVILRSVKPTQTDSGASQSARTQAQYGLLRRDLEHIRETFPGIRHIVGIRNTRKTLLNTNGDRLDVSILATEPDYLHITRSRVQRGRFITPMDQENEAQICVMGSAAARKVCSYNDPIGQSIHIGNDRYLVVGIIENPAALRDAGGDDVNNFIYIPLSTAKARYGDTSSSRGVGTYESVRIELDSIAVQMTDANLVTSTSQRIENFLEKTHKKKDYDLLVPLELIRQKEATQRIWTIVMVVIASISLVVGGVGIMNIMLANVTARRKEIGTRRALGARRADIIYQFLFEAATLTTLGGLAGTAAGYGLARGISHYANWPTVVTATSILLGLGVSCFVGVVFGLWPANEAARVSPIEALRSN
jgi:putative ABC transport system permease protein